MSRLLSVLGGLLLGATLCAAPAGADIRRAGWSGASLNVRTLSNPKLQALPRAVRLAHVALAPGPVALAELRAAAPDAIFYSGPPHPAGDARERMVRLAALAPTWGLRAAATGDPFAGTGVRVTDDRLHLELAGQDLGLVCVNGSVANWPKLLARFPSVDTFNIVLAATADGAAAASTAGPGVDLFLAATAGRSGLHVGLNAVGHMKVHVAAGGAPTLFVVGR